MLEIDANCNPLRTALAGPLAQVRNGICTLTDEPGLGGFADPMTNSETAGWLIATY